MKKKKIFLYLLLPLWGLGGFSACGSDDDKPAPALSVDKTEIDAAAAAGNYTITVTSNTAWTATVNTDAQSWCSVTPPSGDGGLALTVTVTKNTSFFDTRNAQLTLKAGTLTASVAVTQAARACDFSAGSIATAGETLELNGTPIPSVIGSTEDASGGDGNISYQWYKNDAPIDGATLTTYTPPASLTSATGAYTYTRKANDGACNTTPTLSAGSWVLTVACPSFTQPDPSNVSICSGATTTLSLAAATGGYGAITYQWEQSDDNNTWSTATGASAGQDYTTPALTNNMYYRRVATAATCGGSITSASALVTINTTCSIVPGCPNLTVNTVQYDGIGNWSQANTICSNLGMRIPTLDELECLCSNKGSLPGGYANNYYWSSTVYSSGDRYVVYFNGCGQATNGEDNGDYVRCVK